MFPRFEWLFNALLVICWAYVAFYVFPSAVYFLIK
jgi:hypothetical protein